MNNYLELIECDDMHHIICKSHTVLVQFIYVTKVLLTIGWVLQPIPAIASLIKHLIRTNPKRRQLGRPSGRSDGGPNVKFDRGN